MDIRLMRIEDYDETWGLWIHTKEMALNNLDDSREGIRKFLRRNPSTCFVAKEEQKLWELFWREMMDEGGISIISQCLRKHAGKRLPQSFSMQPWKA